MTRRTSPLGPLAVCAALLVGACDDPAGRARIDAVSPDPVEPGDTLVVSGRGFGATPAPGDGVALDGRALGLVEWRNDTLRALVPRDQRAGESLLVVQAQGAGLPPFAVRVGGSTSPTEADVPVPVETDGAVARDATPPGADGRLPDATLEGARAEFLPDPEEGRGLRLQARNSPPGELLLDVVADGDAWGVAFHLVWDPNLLSFVSATPTSAIDGPRTAVWRPLEPGRLAFGGRVPADGAPLLSLRFALVGTGESRLELPSRFASARAPGNVPLGPASWHWQGGTVRSREVAP